MLESVDLGHCALRVDEALQREAHAVHEAIDAVDAEGDAVGRDAAEAGREPHVDDVAGAAVDPLGAAHLHAQPALGKPQGAEQEQAVALGHQGGAFCAAGSVLRAPLNQTATSPRSFGAPPPRRHTTCLRPIGPV